MRSIHVLMVDDDMMVQKFAHLALADRGIKLWNAYDTAEADAILRRRKIDVILCDVLMTPENGLDYCNRLRDRLVRTPVILMSARVSPVAMRDGIKVGAASYMIKPFGIAQIYKSILEVLADSPAAN